MLTLISLLLLAGAEPVPAPLPPTSSSTTTEDTNSLFTLPPDQTITDDEHLVTIEAKLKDPKTQLAWLVLPTITDDKFKYIPLPTEVVVSIPPVPSNVDSYDIDVYAIGDNNGKLGEFILTRLSIIKKTAPLVASATPGRKFVTVVIGKSQEEALSWLKSQTLSDKLSQAGYVLSVLDQTDPKVAQRNLVSFIKTLGVIPAVVVEDSAGHVISGKAVKLPPNEAEFLNLLGVK